MTPATDEVAGASLVMAKAGLVKVGLSPFTGTAGKTGVPLRCISTILSSRTRKYCQQPHGDNVQISRATTGVRGTLRIMWTSSPNISSISRESATCERILLTRTYTVQEDPKIVKSWWDSCIPAASSTIPRPAPISCAAAIAFFGSGPRVTPLPPPHLKIPAPVRAPARAPLAASVSGPRCCSDDSACAQH